jgi:hypothetical protein
MQIIEVKYLMQADLDAELCVTCRSYYVHMRRDNVPKCNTCAGVKNEEED